LTSRDAPLIGYIRSPQARQDTLLPENKLRRTIAKATQEVKKDANCTSHTLDFFVRVVDVGTMKLLIGKRESLTSVDEENDTAGAAFA
jgi:hypothetical protein